MEAVNRDINYMELLEKMDCDVLKFKANIDSGFIQSLVDAGYTEICYASTPDNVARWMQKKSYNYGECAPTSCACTGDIWVESKDCYYSIDLARVDNSTFDIVVIRGCVTQQLQFIEDVNKRRNSNDSTQEF